MIGTGVAPINGNVTKNILSPVDHRHGRADHPTVRKATEVKIGQSNGNLMDLFC
jgi:hypothetical protein